jgi:hypothetical protein
MSRASGSCPSFLRTNPPTTCRVSLQGTFCVLVCPNDTKKVPTEFVEFLTDEVCYTAKWLKSSVERLSGKYSARVMVAYALRYGEHHLPHGFVRRRMALHQSASARTHWTRTSQASQLKSDPRRRLLRPQERLPLAVATEGLPALEDGLRLIQALAHRRDLGAAERRAARAAAVSPWQELKPQLRYCGLSVGKDHWGGRH